MIVVDASVALKWLVPEPGSDAADALLLEDVPRAAPSHVLVEIGQALLRHRRAGGITLDHCRAGLETIQTLLRLLPTEALARDALEIAAVAPCSIYDALYVAAAERWDCSVVTADVKLRNQMAGSRWSDRIRLLSDVPQPGPGR